MRFLTMVAGPVGIVSAAVLTRQGIASMSLERYWPEPLVREVELAKIPIGEEWKASLLPANTRAARGVLGRHRGH